MFKKKFYRKIEVLEISSLKFCRFIDTLKPVKNLVLADAGRLLAKVSKRLYYMYILDYKLPDV